MGRVPLKMRNLWCFTTVCRVSVRYHFLLPYDIDVPKIRVGCPRRDGGYVMAQLGSGGDLLSFGIANDVRFEMEMAIKGRRCFMYDHTIDDLPHRARQYSSFLRRAYVAMDIGLMTCFLLGNV